MLDCGRGVCPAWIRHRTCQPVVVLVAVPAAAATEHEQTEHRPGYLFAIVMLKVVMHVRPARKRNLWPCVTVADALRFSTMRLQKQVQRAQLTDWSLAVTAWAITSAIGAAIGWAAL